MTNPGIAQQLSVVAFACLLPMTGCAPRPERAGITELSGPTMGTRYRVKIPQDKLSADREESIRELVETALEDVNVKMSTYLENSEISRLNRWQASEPFDLSFDTLSVLALATEISAATGGAFDVTVAPLVDAWGFGPPGRPAHTPAAIEIEALRARTGWEKLVFDIPMSTVTKLHPDLTVDLSAVAKGFAVDRVADALDAAALPDYMIEVGGEVRTRGRNEKGQLWRIGIERPIPESGTVELVVPMSDLAMATSGDYRNYYEIDGQRISHTIDPRSGYPISHEIASVTVVMPLCARADAFATALMVLGPEGFDLAENLGLAAYFLQRGHEETFVGRMTSAFEHLLEQESPTP